MDRLKGRQLPGGYGDRRPEKGLPLLRWKPLRPWRRLKAWLGRSRKATQRKSLADRSVGEDHDG